MSLHSAAIKAESFEHQEFTAHQTDDGFVRLEKKAAQAAALNRKISAARTFGTSFLAGVITEASTRTDASMGETIVAHTIGFAAASSGNMLIGMALEDQNTSIQVVGNLTGYLFGLIAAGYIKNVTHKNSSSL